VNPPATRSLEVLLEEIVRCRICASSLPLGPRPVVQVAAGAKVLIVGQAPGRRVHESGVPFDDPSGDRLRDWLGLTPAEFYDPALVAILPMGFCYPGSGSSGDLPPRPECAPAWRERLVAGLTNVQLTVVIGRYAQAWHLPNAPKSVTETVAAWEQSWPEVVPLPHPSPRNDMWLRRNPWFATDLLPVLRHRVAEICAR
jgi:uracil-DNA glycosylase